MTQSLSDGEVEFKLGQEDFTLRPTLRAADKLSRKYGGFNKLLQALAAYELDAFVDVVAHGTAAPKEGLPERVWRSGLIELFGPMQEYVLVLANGGRRAEQAVEADDDHDRPQ